MECKEATRWIVAALITLIAGCAHPELDRIEDALILSDAPQEIKDDLPLSPMIHGLNEQIAYVSRLPLDKVFIYGDRTISRDEFLNGLKRFKEILSTQMSNEKRSETIRAEFDFYEVHGNQSRGDAFMTSYFEPVIRGSRKKTKRFSQPLYKVPPDLVEIKLKDFDEEIRKPRTLWGRIEAQRTERGTRQIVPYFSREEIDGKKKLRRRRSVHCWVDPIDAFFMQIQGSGSVQLNRKRKIRLGYAGQNGHQYKAIGAFLLDDIPLEEMNLDRIEKHLRSLSKEEAAEILYKNPSYVFFRRLKKKPITSNGTQVVAGRTIATDTRFFPKGAIAYLEFKSPTFSGESLNEEEHWQDTSRFVLDQDSGGAIKGGGRLDLFWGAGKEAKKMAGVIKQNVRLYYLAPKIKSKSSLSNLK